MNIGFIELIKFAKTDVDSYVRRGKNGPVKVKKHRRKYVEAAGTLLGGGAIVGAALLMVRRKHTIKKTGKFDSNNPTEWLEKQAKANADEANSVVDVLRKGEGITQTKVKPKKVREPDIWDEPLAPFSTLVNRDKAQGSQPLLLSPAKPKRPDIISPTIVNDEIFPIAPGAYFHGSPAIISKFDPNYRRKGNLLGSGLYTTSELDVAKKYKDLNLSQGKGESTVYQLLEINSDLKLLDFDDDISDTLSEILQSGPYKPSKELLETVRRDFNTITKLNYSDRASGDTNLQKLSNLLLKDFYSVKRGLDSETVESAYDFLDTFSYGPKLMDTLVDKLKGKGEYRGLKGKPPVNKGDDTGSYKIYWYPEQDLRVERVM